MRQQDAPESDLCQGRLRVELQGLAVRFFRTVRVCRFDRQPFLYQLLSLRGEETGEPVFELQLADQSDELIHDLPVAKCKDRWDALHLERRGDIGDAIEFGLDQDHPSLVRGDLPLQQRCQLLAGPAPGCPEIHDNRNLLRSLDRIDRESLVACLDQPGGGRFAAGDVAGTGHVRFSRGKF